MSKVKSLYQRVPAACCKRYRVIKNVTWRGFLKYRCKKGKGCNCEKDVPQKISHRYYLNSSIRKTDQLRVAPRQHMIEVPVSYDLNKMTPLQHKHLKELQSRYQYNIQFSIF